MSLLIALLKENSFNDAIELLKTTPKAAFDKESDLSCIFFSLLSLEVTKLLLEINPDLIQSVGKRGTKAIMTINNY